MGSTFAAGLVVVLVIIHFNVYRDFGMSGVGSWWSAKFLNRPTVAPKPARKSTRRRRR